MYWALLPLEGKLLAALLALMILDVVTGWLTAFLTGTVSSRMSWAGVCRKALTISIVILVGIINAVAPAPIGDFPLLLPTLIGFIGGEAISIIENAKRAGVPLPYPLDRAFRAREDM